MDSSRYKAPGVYVEQVSSGTFPIVGVGTSTAGFIGVMPENFTFKVKDQDGKEKSVPIRPAVKVGEVVLCTNFTEFKEKFLTLDEPKAPNSSDNNKANAALLDRAGGFVGDMEDDKGPFQSHPRYLAHAVYGFFNNGGTRCYVGRVAPPPPPPASSASRPPPEGGEVAARAASEEAKVDILRVLETFETIDEIAIVAAPGIVDKAQQNLLISHCQKPGMEDRVAVLDGPSEAQPKRDEDRPGNSDYAAYYYPWIKVFDPVDGEPLAVPPSGHVAGMYARVDTQRGVHKAPANEVLLGALDVSLRLSRADQEGLNPVGINCIRVLNGNVRVWGARTLGGDANHEFKYINVRRLFNFLRESIDQGTQWAVFEPNDPLLWARITRNVSAFLTSVWSAGGLFGGTPQEAFYVKCDAETNPPANRDNGIVVAEVGVAITRPAEFVVFRLSQSSGLKR